MPQTRDQIRDDIQRRFARIAQSPQKEQKFPCGPASAKRLGYNPDDIDALPAAVTESFAGVGNPLALGELRAGQTVLDLGSGAGFDSILAARQVGPTGQVIGTHGMPSSRSTSSRMSSGSRTSRSILLTKVMMGVSR